MDLPTGTVSFLFTDIEGSSRLWEKHHVTMYQAVARHDSLLQSAVVENNGHVVKMRGDGLHAVFASVQDAVAAAVAGQRALQAEEWDEGIDRIPVRMGVHSGSAQLRDGDYFGPTVNRAARLQDAGHGSQILLSQVSATLIDGQLPVGISLLDLGRHQIKDFPAPERVYQVLAPELPNHFPPLRASGRRRTNLPTQTTGFVGREREIKAAKQMLEQARLVTLTGPGGTGKTRLALQVARKVFDRYRDGVWLVELAPLTEETMVLPAIAKVFALQPDPARSLETVMADFLRDKKMLMLLDNCEHLIETCARVADELLGGSSGLVILASSREALGVPREMVLRVPSLSVPAHAGVSVAELQHSEAAQLLAERARAVRHDFEINDENTYAVAEICRRLDGIPLAIELAASRLRLFSPQQLASRLSDRFRLLTGGSRTALPRQQTLQALIDWSYELLSDQEQALFRRLSVFVGGWTFEAAEAIGEELNVLELLDQLVNKSLVQSELGAAEIRFRYLETIRQYARDRLFAAGEGEIVRDLNFTYFSDLVAREVKNLDGPHRDKVRLTLRPEIDNFRQALGWQISRDTVAAVDMLVDVVFFMVQDTGWGDQYAAVSRADVLGWLEAATKALDERALDQKEGLRLSWARIHLVAGQSAIGEGKFDFARSETAKAIALARELDDLSTLMAALGFYAITASAQQSFDQKAIEAADEGLALARKLGSTFYKSAGLTVLAGYEIERGNDVAAQAYLAEATMGGGFMTAMATFQAGVSFAHTDGDMSRALSFFQESRRLFRSIENAHFVAITTSLIAHTRRRSGELDAAEAAYRESLAEFHWQGHSPAVAHELECLAFIARKRNAPERAARLLGAAEALREQIQVPMLPDEQAEYDLELSALRQELNDDAFQKVWIAGRVMGTDQAVEYALAGLMPEEGSESPDIWECEGP
jgi:predicted ATPase/class 3 adenylate cyclase